MESYTKIYFDAPGYYAPRQYDTAYDGSPMIGYWKVADKQDGSFLASKWAREKGLGTPIIVESPEGMGFDRII